MEVDLDVVMARMPPALQLNRSDSTDIAALTERAIGTSTDRQPPSFPDWGLMQLRETPECRTAKGVLAAAAL